jgi:NADH:ubiquinone oxidoreductase subunit F (NADH-binding)
MAGESAGQCGPCVHGLASIAGTANDLALGRARREAVADLARWAAQVEGRGACKMPDGAIRFLRSAMDVFGADLRYHAAGQPCRAASAPWLLPVPPPPDPRDDGAWR